MSYDYAAAARRTCQACGNQLDGKRFGALTCSDRCRKRLSRKCQAITAAAESARKAEKGKSKKTSKPKQRVKK